MVKHRKATFYPSRNWCVTLNIGHEDDEYVINLPESEVINMIWKSKRVLYSIIQLECGSTRHNYHYQCYIHFNHVVKLSAVRNLFPSDSFLQIHCENMITTSDLCIEYCKKEETRCRKYIEVGSPPQDPSSGVRNDLIKGMELTQKCNSWREVMNTPELSKLASYALPTLREWFLTRPLPRFEDIYGELFVPLPWQEFVLENILNVPPHPRRIHWFVDKEGDKGKTFFAEFLCFNLNAVILPTDYKESNYIYDGQDISIFDLEASTDMDKISYGAIECQKKLISVNTKYLSCNKFNPPHHVLVFSNSYPKRNKFTANRLDLYELNGDEIISLGDKIPLPPLLHQVYSKYATPADILMK